MKKLFASVPAAAGRNGGLFGICALMGMCLRGVVHRFAFGEAVHLARCGVLDVVDRGGGIPGAASGRGQLS